MKVFLCRDMQLTQSLLCRKYPYMYFPGSGVSKMKIFLQDCFISFPLNLKFTSELQNFLANYQVAELPSFSCHESHGCFCFQADKQFFSVHCNYLLFA